MHVNTCLHLCTCVWTYPCMEKRRPRQGSSQEEIRSQIKATNQERTDSKPKGDRRLKTEKQAGVQFQHLGR